MVQAVAPEPAACLALVAEHNLAVAAGQVVGTVVAVKASYAAGAAHDITDGPVYHTQRAAAAREMATG